jgi:DNA-binding beta-propeller fold protein YncE
MFNPKPFLLAIILVLILIACQVQPTSQLQFLFKFGSSSAGPGEFSNPGGVATDSKNNLIVADAGNSRIQVFDSSGEFLFKFGSLDLLYLST